MILKVEAECIGDRMFIDTIKFCTHSISLLTLHDH